MIRHTHTTHAHIDRYALEWRAPLTFMGLDCLLHANCILTYSRQTSGAPSPAGSFTLEFPSISPHQSPGLSPTRTGSPSNIPAMYPVHVGTYLVSNLPERALYLFEDNETWTSTCTGEYQCTRGYHATSEPCDLVFGSLRELRHHERIHELGFRCGCGRTFRVWGSLEYHKKAGSVLAEATIATWLLGRGSFLLARKMQRCSGLYL